MKPAVSVLLFLFLVIWFPGNRYVQAEEQAGAPRTWSVNFGPNAKNWGYVGVTKDFLVNERLSLFVTGGLGTFLAGGGVAFYTRSYHESSFVFSSTVGLVGADVNACYQLKAGEHGFVTAGVSYGDYFMQYRGFLPVVSYEIRF